MKKLIVFFCLVLILSCGTTKMNYDYFYTETSVPEVVIDSLGSVYNMKFAERNTWDSVPFFTNENKILYMYTYSTKRNDSLFVFTSVPDSNTYTVKMRIESKQKKQTKTK